MRLATRSSLLILPAYALATLIVTWPLASAFAKAIPSSRTAFDPALQAFILGWDLRSIRSCIPCVFNAPIFFPEQRTLTYMDHLLGEAVTAGPVFFVTGFSVAAAYNFLFLMSFVASAWGTYRLVRLFLVPRSGAFLCGLLYAFSSYRFSNLDLLNQLQTQFLPFGLFFAVRYLQRWRFRDLIGMFTVMVSQVYFGWYYSFYLTLALGLLFLYALACRAWQPPRDHGPRLLVLVTIAALSILPVVRPYLEQSLAMPGFHRSLGEAALYSADVIDYLRLSPLSVLAGLLPLPVGSQAYWPGVVAVALAAVGAARVAGRARHRGAERMRLSGYFVVCAVSSFILSLGPILHVAGNRTWIPLPYSLLYFTIPGFSSMRAPARFAVLTLLCVTVLAGLGYLYLRERLGDGRPFVWRAIAVGIFAFAGLCAFMHPPSLMELPTARSMPDAYKWLAAQQGGPLLEFPVPARESDEDQTHALRQFCSLYHRKPLIDGCSGYASPAYESFRWEAQSFPSDGALAAVQKMGARWILVHYDDYSRAVRESLMVRIAEVPRFVPRARFNHDVVYELSGSPPIQRNQ